jgi:hypothetical protein
LSPFLCLVLAMEKCPNSFGVCETQIHDIKEGYILQSRSVILNVKAV